MRSIVRVGKCEAAVMREASESPTLAASRPFPPHEGEGGIYAATWPSEGSRRT